MAYQGPGDIKSGALGFWGMRALSAAKAATAPFACFDLYTSGGSFIQTINILSNGAVDYTTLSGLLSSNPGALCGKLYDQCVAANHLVAPSTATMPTVKLAPFTGSGALGTNQVALQFTNAAASVLKGGNLASQALPVSFAGFGKRTNTTVEG